METIYKDFKIKSEYKGDKAAPWGDRQENWNNHIITVKNITTGKRTSFEFWASIMHPEIQTEDDLLNAFECFVSDALSGENSFEDFCNEYGYDTDSRSAERTHKACVKSNQKLKGIYAGDLYELANELNEKING